MTQTLALLLDAYRELNARKMFWISLIISGLVMVGFGLLGLNDKGLTLLWIDLPAPAPRFWYKYIFSSLVIGWWVSFGAMILALISTASIFPDLLVSGSIDLYLAKPIGRVRLFLTKYFGGLLFVLLQASVFSVGSYLVFGLRAGQWRPSLFLLIPLTTLLFSYLFVFCVLMGVLTRSTIAAILVTCLFWLICGVTNKAEQALFVFRTMQTAEARSYQRQADELDVQIEDLKKHPSFTNVFGFREQRMRKRRDELRASADQAATAARKLTTAHRIVKGVATVMPKTGETIDLLDRKLFSDEDLASFRKEMGPGKSGGFEQPPPPPPHSRRAIPASMPSTGPSSEEPTAAEVAQEMEQNRVAAREGQEEADRAARSRSLIWILGTSVGFETVVLAWAAWIFCRRDY